VIQRKTLSELLTRAKVQIGGREGNQSQVTEKFIERKSQRGEQYQTPFSCSLPAPAESAQRTIRAAGQGLTWEDISQQQGILIGPGLREEGKGCVCWPAQDEIQPQWSRRKEESTCVSLNEMKGLGGKNEDGPITTVLNKGRGREGEASVNHKGTFTAGEVRNFSFPSVKEGGGEDSTRRYCAVEM